MCLVNHQGLDSTAVVVTVVVVRGRGPACRCPASLLPGLPKSLTLRRIEDQIRSMPKCQNAGARVCVCDSCNPRSPVSRVRGRSTGPALDRDMRDRTSVGVFVTSVGVFVQVASFLR